MDTISNMLIMIKNAGNAHKEVVEVSPYSKFKHSVADCLKREGYLESVSKKTRKGGLAMLEIKLIKADEDPKITNVKRLSKPSRRIYVSVKDIRPVKNGYGRLILSTPKGILTGEQARKEHVGGEALFTIW